MDYKEKIKELPTAPGVYLMKDVAGTVLYVGKAANIRKRVSSYFYPNKKAGDRISALVGKIADIAHIQTSTEAEALIYENGLIKQLSPRYNVALRDDKSYPLLKLTINEKFPRLFITRQKKTDGALYYGPYTNAKLLKQALILLRQMFPLRSCGKMQKSACLNYRIKQCRAPCAGEIDERAYGNIISELKLFLDGRKQDLINILTERMNYESKKENFEEAGRIKNRIEALGSIKEKAVIYKPAGELEELKAVLKLGDELDTIEAFDVSNIMGKQAVGSVICFSKARPNKSGYRKFRIKTISKIDDYAMMREIVRRRYERVLKEGARLPGLILIDGGKAHLAAAAGELEKLGLSAIPVIGIAKEFERIYVRDSSEPLILPPESKALHLLMRIRDEAHRFAIAYHKSLLSKKIKLSEMDRIPLIGDKRKRELVRYFGNIAGIRRASVDDILKVRGMDKRSAQNVVEYFKGR